MKYLSLALFLIFIVQFSLVEERTNQPNVIFILAYELGSNHSGAYGQKIIRTPNINKLATQGIRFTQFYAGANVCGPSRT